jgi:hypothetical protein
MSDNGTVSKKMNGAALSLDREISTPSSAMMVSSALSAPTLAAPFAVVGSSFS